MFSYYRSIIVQPETVAYLPLGHLGHPPPFELWKIFAYGKNAILETFVSQENS